jgi:hypothetical protein
MHPVEASFHAEIIHGHQLAPLAVVAERMRRQDAVIVALELDHVFVLDVFAWRLKVRSLRQ